MDYFAAVVITSRNRKLELRSALQSCLSQDLPVEVLVLDDGSTDGTEEMVRREFPQVRLERSPHSLGLIAQRTRAAHMVSAPIIVSIDDDAVFASPATIRQTLADFDHPRVGAVAIPYVDVRVSTTVRQRAPAPTGVYVCSEYRGTAHALRRDLFVALGGYRGQLFFGGEERDYCVRLLDVGFVTRLGRADPIHHLESPRRDRSRRYMFVARNNVLFAWHNCPLLYLPAHLLVTTFNLVCAGFRDGYPWSTVQGIARGYAAFPSEYRERNPVSASTYRLFNRLRHRGPFLLDEIECHLSPVRRIPMPA